MWSAESKVSATLTEDWDVDDDSTQAAQKLIVLLKTTQNRDIGNQGFDVKLMVLAKSGYDLTKQVGESAQWGLSEIRERQAKRAQLAVKTWPVN